MAVTAKMIKELREKTGAGMSDCKNVLVEANGDFERAQELLREKGLAKAEQKSGRSASEGLACIKIAENKKSGAIVEVNCETDFVAKNEKFVNYVNDVTEHALNSEADNLEDFLNMKWKNGNSSVKDELMQQIAVIGENLIIRRFKKIKSDGCLISYIHGGGKIGVLLSLSCEYDEKINEVGKNVCMQIAAMSPKFISRDAVDKNFIEKEKSILMQQALNEGKNQEIAEKMVNGRLNKEFKEICLLDQVYVKDNDLSIEKYLNKMSKELGKDIKVSDFVRFSVGEEIEDKK